MAENLFGDGAPDMPSVGLPGVDWISAGSKVLGEMLSDSGGATSSAVSGNFAMNNGGWNVGSGSASAFSLPWYAWAALGVGLFVWVKNKENKG